MQLQKNTFWQRFPAGHGLEACARRARSARNQSNSSQRDGKGPMDTRWRLRGGRDRARIARSGSRSPPCHRRHRPLVPRTRTPRTRPSAACTRTPPAPAPRLTTIFSGAPAPLIRCGSRYESASGASRPPPPSPLPPPPRLLTHSSFFARLASRNRSCSASSRSSFLPPRLPPPPCLSALPPLLRCPRLAAWAQRPEP